MNSANLKEAAAGLWRYVREVTGDDAYERYVAHHQVTHAGEATLTRREYFKKRQDEKWKGVTRCC
jgi:uncharacterized short protein YbdD (DUF466 family)